MADDERPRTRVEIEARLAEIDAAKTRRRRWLDTSSRVARESLPDIIGTVVGGGILALLGLIFGVIGDASTFTVLSAASGLITTLILLLAVVNLRGARTDIEELELLQRLAAHQPDVQELLERLRAISPDLVGDDAEARPSSGRETGDDR